MKAWSLLSLVIERHVKKGLRVYFDGQLVIVSLKRICLSIHILEFCNRVSDRIFCAINFEWRKSHAATIFGQSLLDFFLVDPHFFVLYEYRFEFTHQNRREAPFLRDVLLQAIRETTPSSLSRLP